MVEVREDAEVWIASKAMCRRLCHRRNKCPAFDRRCGWAMSIYGKDATVAVTALEDHWQLVPKQETWGEWLRSRLGWLVGRRPPAAGGYTAGWTRALRPRLTDR